jgi:hypothetical protein
MREKFEAAKQMVDIVWSVKLQAHLEKEMSSKQENRGPKEKMSGKIMKIVLDLLLYAGSFKAVAPGWMVTDIPGKGLSHGKTDIWISAGLQETEALAEATQPQVIEAHWPAPEQGVSAIKLFSSLLKLREIRVLVPCKPLYITKSFINLFSSDKNRFAILSACIKSGANPCLT